MSKQMLFWVILDIDSWQVSQVRFIYFIKERYTYLFVYLLVFITNIKRSDQEINTQTQKHFAVHWVLVCFSQGKYID